MEHFIDVKSGGRLSERAMPENGCRGPAKLKGVAHLDIVYPSITVVYTVTLSLESWQVRRVLLLDLPTNNINFITTMASNASDNRQTNTSTLSTARFNPTVPTDLQHAYSLDGNTDLQVACIQQSGPW